MGDPPTEYLDTALNLVLWPSPDEIHSVSTAEPYLAGLRDFYDSHDAVLSSLREQRFHYEWTQHLGVDGRGRGGQPRLVQRHAPPVTVELVVDIIEYASLIASAAGLFQTMKNWLDDRRGRKISLRVGDQEIEATNLTSEQFTSLVQTIIDHQNANWPTGGERTHDAFSRFPVMTFQMHHDAQMHLHNLYWESARQAGRFGGDAKTAKREGNPEHARQDSTESQ